MLKTCALKYGHGNGRHAYAHIFSRLSCSSHQFNIFLINHTQSVRQDFIELFFSTVRSFEFMTSYPAVNMDGGTFVNQFQSLDILAFPGRDIEPCRFRDSIALPCFVEEVCDK